MLYAVCRVAALALIHINATRSMTELHCWQPHQKRSCRMPRLAFFALVAVLLCAVSALAVAESAQTPPPPSQAAPPPPCRSAVRGAARGAAGGAMIGAVAGDAGKGAAIGATVGGVGRAARNGSARSSGQCY